MNDLDQFEIIAIDHTNVDSGGYCGANLLGHARKREWIKQCLPNGLRYKGIRERVTGKWAGMIEYMPAEFAWRSVYAPNHLVIHCLQVVKQWREQGLGSRLLQECIDDAQRHEMDGVVAIATKAGWCADSRIYLKHGFEVADRAAPAFELLVKRLQVAAPPYFGNWEQRLQALGPGIFMYNCKQCPFMRGDKAIARKAWLQANYGLDVNVVEITDHEMAQANPCVWGTSGIICYGKIVNYVPGGDQPLLKQLKRLKVIP